MRAINNTRSTPIALTVVHARTLWARSRGLLGRDRLEPGAGLLLEPCSGIHTVGMAYPIDALFLNRDGRVIHLVDRMKPMRFSRYILRAHSVLELPPGTIQQTGTLLGDRVVFEK